ncbi:MAG: hypothetical protein IIZ39_13610 [Blautia sp.]|nr:hypothetical protein [Blautia sp.]
MKLQRENMTMALLDAGCKKDAIEKAKRLLEAGDAQDLIRHLRLCRCELVEDLHKSQRRVDCMDFLIRQTEKQLL